MWKGLFDGITVPPSVGRRRKTELPIPEVVGEKINPPTSETNIKVIQTPIHTRKTQRLSIEPESFEIDISPYIRVFNIDPPFNINIVSAKEFTRSSPEQERIQDEIVATINERGIVTYNPIGTYVRNALFIQVAVSNDENPLSPVEQALGNVYQEEGIADTLPAPEPGGRDLVILPNGGTFIGNPDELSQYWVDQGIDPTCMAAATGSILASLGLSDYEEVLQNSSVYIGDDGEYYVYNEEGELVRGSTPLITHYGQPIYVVDYFRNALGIPFINEETGEPYRRIRLARDVDPEFTPQVIPGETFIRQYHSQSILNHYGVDNHYGYMTDFTQLAALLSSGRKILARVDAYELWFSNGALIREAQENANSDWDDFYGYEGLNPLDSDTSHLLWITGLRQNPDGEWIIILNDTNLLQGEGGAEYSLQRFLAAWEDSEFTYIATGPPIQTSFSELDSGYVGPTNQETDVIESAISEYFPHTLILTLPEHIQEDFREEIGGGNIILGMVPYRVPKKLLELDPRILFPILNKIEESFPGFKQKFGEWARKTRAEQDRITDLFGLDSDDIKKIDEIVANLIDE